jgi:hypothetical protein
LILVVVESVIHSFAIEQIGGFLHGVAIFYSVENHGRKISSGFCKGTQIIGPGIEQSLFGEAKARCMKAAAKRMAFLQDPKK